MSNAPAVVISGALPPLDKIHARVVKVISDQFPHDFKRAGGENLDDTARLAEALDLDSLDGVELIMAMEEEFDIEIPDEEIDNLVTISDFVLYLSRIPRILKE